MTTLDFREVDAPTDDPPALEIADFDPEFPGSTPEAPYGFKEDGTPYKRRPKGSGTGGSKTPRSTASKANETLATSAARMLCQINSLVGISLTVFGMPETAMDIEKANAQFETMAIESLRTDPTLCRKILSAGASSGRTGLLMAYIYLAGSAFPSARSEIKAKRRIHELEGDDVDDATV